MPTIVSYPRSHAFKAHRDGRPRAGQPWNCQVGRWEEPSIAERERAMGFVEGDTFAGGLTDGDRCELIGRSMVRHMMAWMGGMLAALNLP